MSNPQSLLGSLLAMNLWIIWCMQLGKARLRLKVFRRNRSTAVVAKERDDVLGTGRKRGERGLHDHHTKEKVLLLGATCPLSTIHSHMVDRKIGLWVPVLRIPDPVFLSDRVHPR